MSLDDMDFEEEWKRFKSEINNRKFYFKSGNEHWGIYTKVKGFMRIIYTLDEKILKVFIGMKLIRKQDNGWVINES